MGRNNPAAAISGLPLKSVQDCESMDTKLADRGFRTGMMSILHIIVLNHD